MKDALPDVSLTDPAPRLSPLEWVGMQGIDLPLTLAEPGYHRELHARADVAVDLPAPQVKGIHMSRLYRLLDTLGQGEPLSPAGLHRLLQSMIESHRDCDSRSARLGLGLDLLVRRPALVTQGLSGWKSYPVRLDASLVDGIFRSRVEVTVAYSSTCPCSAALARQLIEHAFSEAFGQQEAVQPQRVVDWLRQHASLATPHSQRSEARVSVDVAGYQPTLGLLSLIDAIERSVGTPVQTAVKRADEQAFAALNGQNLMFVEDAARRIGTAVADYGRPRVFVRHMESLHPHDAVANASPTHKETASMW
jgi:GTP cyclohydrolase I